MESDDMLYEDDSLQYLAYQIELEHRKLIEEDIDISDDDIGR